MPNNRRNTQTTEQPENVNPTPDDMAGSDGVNPETNPEGTPNPEDMAEVTTVDQDLSASLEQLEQLDALITEYKASGQPALVISSLATQRQTTQAKVDEIQADLENRRSLELLDGFKVDITDFVTSLHADYTAQASRQLNNVLVSVTVNEDGSFSGFTLNPNVASFPAGATSTASTKIGGSTKAAEQAQTKADREAAKAARAEEMNRITYLASDIERFGGKVGDVVFADLKALVEEHADAKLRESKHWVDTSKRTWHYNIGSKTPQKIITALIASGQTVTANPST